MIALLLLGFAFGFLMSVPPGPATVVILARARLAVRWALQGVLGLVTGEIMILSFFCLVGGIAWSLHPLTRVLAGAFLVGFAVRTWEPKVERVGAQQKNTLWLTLLNPAVWISLAGLTSFIGVESRWHVVAFFVGLEVGVAAWFLVLAMGSRRLSLQTLVFLQRGAGVAIASIGIVFSGYGLYQTLSL